jgi:hypothetical protein
MSMFDRMKDKAEEFAKKNKPKIDELREKAAPYAQTLKEKAERAGESLKTKADEVAEGMRQGTKDADSPETTSTDAPPKSSGGDTSQTGDTKPEGT